MGLRRFSLNLDVLYVFLWGLGFSLWRADFFCFFHAFFKHVFTGHGVLHFGQNWTCTFGTALGTCLITSHLPLVGKVKAFLKCVHGEEVDIQRLTYGFDQTAQLDRESTEECPFYILHLQKDTSLQVPDLYYTFSIVMEDI